MVTRVLFTVYMRKILSRLTPSSSKFVGLGIVGRLVFSFWWRCRALTQPQVVSLVRPQAVALARLSLSPILHFAGASTRTSVLVLFNNTLTANSTCYVQVDLIHRQILLEDDAGTTWSGIPENSQCSLYGAGSSFGGLGNTA